MQQQSWDREWLARVLPRAAVAAVLGGWLLAIGARAVLGPAPGPWGGDLPAFLVGGRMLLEGHGHALYDFALQESLQQGMPRDGFLPYLYPPVVALAYAPLALLPYDAAEALHLALSVVAVMLACRALRPASPWTAADPWRALAFALCFQPLLRAIPGGQNSAFSLLLLCLAGGSFVLGRDGLAGLALGLLAYKPQLALPLLGVVLLSGRARAVAAAALTVAGLLLACAATAGPAWTGHWLAALAPYVDADRANNAVATVSLARWSDLAGWGRAWMLPAALACVAVAWRAWQWQGSRMPRLLAAGACVGLMASPHAMYYDAALLLPGLAWMVDAGHGRLACVLWMGAMLQEAAPGLGASPLLVVLPAASLVLLYSSAESSRSSLANSSSRSVE